MDVKDNRPDNVNRRTAKFRSGVEYARRYLHDFQHRFMLWTSIVTRPESASAKHHPFEDLREIPRNLWASYRVEVEMVVNEICLARLNELRELAGQETAASEYPIFRMMQIIEPLQRHVERLEARGIDAKP